MQKQSNDENSPVEIAFGKIKEMMYFREIVPGQKIACRELAKKFDLSVTPIIQALNRLQTLNIVSSERHKGYFMGEVNIKEAKELFSARDALETYIIPDIIRNLNKRKIVAIEKAMEKHIKAKSDFQYRHLLLIFDSDFHLKLIEAAENEVIYNMAKLTFERIYLKYRPEYLLENRLKETGTEHRLLFEALKSGDRKKSKTLIRQHIKKGREHIIGSLDRKKSLEI